MWYNLYSTRIINYNSNNEKKAIKANTQHIIQTTSTSVSSIILCICIIVYAYCLFLNLKFIIFYLYINEI